MFVCAFFRASNFQKCATHPSSFAPSRVLTKSSPPFGIVHANAAYTRLCGNDSHEVAGQPLSKLLVLPRPVLPKLSSCGDTDKSSHQKTKKGDPLHLSPKPGDPSPEQNLILKTLLSSPDLFGTYHGVYLKTPHFDRSDDSISGTSKSRYVKCCIAVSPVVSSTARKHGGASAAGSCAKSKGSMSKGSSRKRRLSWGQIHQDTSVVGESSRCTFDGPVSHFLVQIFPTAESVIPDPEDASAQGTTEPGAGSNSQHGPSANDNSFEAYMVYGVGDPGNVTGGPMTAIG
jgi:hypothetical protein